jgi:hypothetical protein
MTGDEEEGEGEERGRAKKEHAAEKEKCYGHIFGGGARTRQTARITAGSARLKQPPAGAPPSELSKESTPETDSVVEEVQEDSSEDRRIEELKTTKAQLDEELRLKTLRIAEREKELQLRRDREAAQVLEEQQAKGRKRSEEIEQEAMETKEGVLKPGGEDRQTRGDEEREEEPLRG